VTRVGTLELRVPQDRAGRFSTELFERYQRSEKALVAALAEMYVQGVSTRKVKAVTEELCGHAFSASTLGSTALVVPGRRWPCRPSRALLVAELPVSGRARVRVMGGKLPLFTAIRRRRVPSVLSGRGAPPTVAGSRVWRTRRCSTGWRAA
jgi:Transposase, Mutator family